MLETTSSVRTMMSVRFIGVPPFVERTPAADSTGSEQTIFPERHSTRDQPSLALCVATHRNEPRLASPTHQRTTTCYIWQGIIGREFRRFAWSGSESVGRGEKPVEISPNAAENALSAGSAAGGRERCERWFIDPRCGSVCRGRDQRSGRSRERGGTAESRHPCGRAPRRPYRGCSTRPGAGVRA